MVDQIKVYITCTELEIEILTKYLKEHGINVKPEALDLYTTPDKSITIGDIKKDSRENILKI